MWLLRDAAGAAAAEAEVDDRDAVAELLGRDADGRVRRRRARRAAAAGRDPQRAVARRRHADADALLAGRRRDGARSSRLEAAGGVQAAEAAVDPDELAAAHARYAAERDAAIPADHAGPRPTAGWAAPGAA